MKQLGGLTKSSSLNRGASSRIYSPREDVAYEEDPEDVLEG